VRPLSNIGTGMQQAHFLDLSFTANLDRGPTLFRRTKGEANIFKGAGNTYSTSQVRFPWYFFRKSSLLDAAIQIPFLAIPLLMHRQPQLLSNLPQAEEGFPPKGANLLSANYACGFRPGPFPSFSAIMIHLKFCSKSTLWATKTAKCAIWNIIGVNGVRIDLNVWNFIRSSTHKRRISLNLG
jgi:hypothetical protein